MPLEPIAIVGAACRLPGSANTPDQFWDVLVNGRDTTSDVPADRFEIERFYAPQPKQKGKIVSRRGAFVDGDLAAFDAGYFRLAARECNAMDPQQRMLLEVTAEALADAGIPQEAIAGSAAAVYVGTFNGDYETLGYTESENVDLYTVLGGGRYALANRISYAFDLRGPSMHVDTACSSTATAVHLACEHLRQGEGRVALVGGCNLLVNPHLNIGLSYSGVLSPSGKCKFGDASADGYIRGEAVGVLVLKRLADALADGSRIYAVIRASGVNHDGASNGLLIQPSEVTQVALMHEVWAAAGISAGDIDYIEAHGTGTRVGDPIELRGFGRALAGRDLASPCLVGSVKSNVGHAEGGSAFASILKIALSLRARTVPPSLHFREPHPDVPWGTLPLRINTAAEAWPTSHRPGIAVMNSFGMTGTNVHLVFEEFVPAAAPPAPTPAALLLPVSARSEAALRAAVAAMATYLRTTPERLADVCHSAGTRATHHAWRVAAVGGSAEELAADLERQAVAAPRERAPRVAFVYGGQGSAWAGMGRAWLAQSAVFREAIAEVDRAYPALSVLDELQRPDAESRFADTRVAQVCIFAVQLGLTRMLAEAGVVPGAVVGHSLGELAAAHAAGVLDLAEALRVIELRSALMCQEAIRGGMIATELDGAACQALLDELGADGPAVAALNGPTSTVVSGSAAELARWSALCAERGVATRMLDVAFAFHGRALAPFGAVLAGELAGLQPRPARLAFYSSVRPGEQALDAAYWARNMTDAVAFRPTFERLLADGWDTVIEISPHAVLAANMRAMAGPGAAVLPAMRRGEPAERTFARALGALYARGLAPRWQAVSPAGRVVSLPPYPFQRGSYWITRRPAAYRSDWFYEVAWEPRELPATEPDDGPWLVFGQHTGPRRATTVLPGAGFAQVGPDAFTIDPASAADYRAVFAALAARGEAPTRVVVRCEEAAHWLDQHERSCRGALYAFQALLDSGLPARFWLVTGGAVGAGTAAMPGAGAVAGMARALALEAPDLWGGHVDLDDMAIALEPWAPLDELVLARRDGRWLAPRLTRRRPDTTPLPVRADGCYLVTGGLGHLGQALAEHLVRRGASELVLVSRQGLAHPDAAAVVARLGVKVHVLAADVARKEDVARVLAYVDERCAPLRGVLHGAGTYGEQPVAGLGYEAFAAALAPKVLGGWHLHELTRDRPLDCFVLLSSIAAVWGAGGQVAYCAANAFLDGLAAHRRSLGLPASCQNWGMWAGGGMASPEVAARLERTGVLPMAIADALAAFDHAGSGAVVADMDWERFVGLYASRRPCRFFERLVTPAAPEPPRPATPDRAFVLARLAAVLGSMPAEADLDHGFLALGLDSLMAVELASSLAAAGVQTSVRALLSAPSVRGWLAELAFGEAERLVPASGPAPAPALAPSGPPASAPAPALAPSRPAASAPAPAPGSHRPAAPAPEAPRPAARGVAEPWWFVHEPRPNARLRLVCFPYAGGGPSVFARWSAALPPDVEVVSVVLPGRAHRLEQQPFRCMTELTDQLAPALEPLFDRDVVFFGHCLGALVMFEVAHRLLARGLRPRHLVVSGARAPQFYHPEQLELDVMQFSPVPGVPGHELDLPHFIEFLKDLNFDTSAALYESQEMREIMLPAVQADLAVNNLYVYRDRPPLPLPITVVGGRVDPYVTAQHLKGWQAHTQQRFQLHMRPGDHYFIERERPFLTELVGKVGAAAR